MIACDRVSYSHHGDVLLKDISVSLSKCQIHGFVGKNGSGKTMLLKVLCGYLRPTTGHVTIDGKRLYSEIQFPPSMGLILETPGFLPFVSGRQNLRILAGICRKIDEKRINSILEMVGLQKASGKWVGQYSLGMRQRLGIAQAIMEDPDLLILDEPFNGLDTQGILDMRNLFKHLRAEGKTMILTSHNTEDIDELCDTVYQMDTGILTRVR